MQLVYIALIGVGAAVVVGLFGPLAIKAGRALQEHFGSSGKHVHAVGGHQRVRY
jgi:hypothetical protein